MRVWVTGHTGMLGRAVLAAARSRGLEICFDPEESHPGDQRPYQAPYLSNDVWEIFDVFKRAVGRPDVVINCAGAIPLSPRQGHEMIEANAVIPFKLAEACRRYGCELVHVSTDCVFAGRDMLPQLVVDRPDAEDLYGRSKALGEMCYVGNPNVTVVRTSFIGLDHGLLPWLSGEAIAGRPVQGYAGATWTGSTVWEVAERLLDIAGGATLERGIQHLATRKVWTKAAVLRRLADVLGLKVEITDTLQPQINRALMPTIEMRDLADTEVTARLLEEWHRVPPS